MTQILGLTVLRGVAALAVLAFHVALLVAARTEGAVAAPFQHGWAGVDLFFALSAFLLASPLVGRPSRLTAPRFWGLYLRGRALRIAPPYYASILLALALGAGLGYVVEGWRDVLLHVFFAHGFSAHSYTSINPVYWTLAIEAQFYVLLPLLVWLIDRPRGVWVAVFLVASSVALRFFVYGTSVGFLAVQLPGFLAPFALGVVAARVFMSKREPSRRFAVGVAGLGALGAVAVLALLPAGSVVQAMDTRWTATFVRPALGAAAASLILGVAWLGRGSQWADSLTLRIAAWPGEISYSLYLVHFPVLAWFAGGPGAHLAGTPIFVPLLIALPVAVAAVFHRFLERPFLTRRRRWFRGTTSGVPSVPSLAVSGGKPAPGDPAP